ncbi:hypothetical protein [Rhizobium binae]|uniref:hypothetical protein n=1 Tax=Rhizobium binae TaxID=1138190 RepID=UPI001C83CCDA|nr:hypothetical protein [Rhizobium binae]MBX4967866.1 hypothetical protein [Rhizobium binae]
MASIPLSSLSTLRAPMLLIARGKQRDIAFFFAPFWSDGLQADISRYKSEGYLCALAGPFSEKDLNAFTSAIRNLVVCAPSCWQRGEKFGVTSTMWFDKGTIPTAREAVQLVLQYSNELSRRDGEAFRAIDDHQRLEHLCSYLSRIMLAAISAPHSTTLLPAPRSPACFCGNDEKKPQCSAVLLSPSSNKHLQEGGRVIATWDNDEDDSDSATLVDKTAARKRVRVIRQQRMRKPKLPRRRIGKRASAVAVVLALFCFRLLQWLAIERSECHLQSRERMSSAIWV